MTMRSFWIGGYEGADHVNGQDLALDMVAASGHLAELEADHRRAAELGLMTLRESIGWRLAEPAPGRFDFARARRVAASARALGQQVLWTFMHYGTPADVDLFDDRLVERFARFAGAAARALRDPAGPPPVYNLINEIGFLAWAATATDQFAPYGRGATASTAESGYAVKCRLVRATLAGMRAVLEVEPRARFLQIEPLVRVVAPHDRPELSPRAAEIEGYQWQVWDLLAGTLEPSLGGHAAALDLIGVNWYHSGQWEIDTEKRLRWHEDLARRDTRRMPFSQVLERAWRRYGRPLIVAETGHFGAGRAAWLDEIAAEVARARRRGVGVDGLCLYPLVDRPDWNDAHHWHRSGLWDACSDPRGDPGARAGAAADVPDLDDTDPRGRRLCQPLASALARWQARLPPSPGTSMTTLIVFSHLRWGFVYQRPQHLLSRLAGHYRVVFIEEPLRGDGPARLEVQHVAPDLDVVVPRTPVEAAGFHDDQLPLLTPLLADFMREQAIDDYLVWFYTPMALPLIAQLQPRLVVYDCMDELSAFKDAPRQLRQRETALMKIAGLVFTGGPALFEAKKDQHPHVHCLPSSVDAFHFTPSRLDAASAEAVEAERLQGALPRPRLGYFGVIDERLDLVLLAALADAKPEWQIVMAGPVVKIDPASLPRRPNLHWLGMQPYARLPYLLGGWDVALMPFALNDATRFISPTKTLEYLAGEKPVVSTAIGDVIALYGNVVRIAADAHEFIAACQSALSEHSFARGERERESIAMVFRSSWDHSAEAVRQLLQQGLAEAVAPVPGLREATGLQSASESAATLAAGRPPRRVRHLVVGAGPTGLSAAYHLGLQSARADTLLVEREASVGGWCRSITQGGFTFDQAGHIMFSNDPYVLELYGKLLGGNVHWQNREAWIWSKNVYTRYPFQGSLYGLPPEVLKECIVGAIEARFGPLDGRADAPRPERAPPANFAEFIDRTWGAGIAKHFATPYNEKLWAVPLEEMETSWLGGRVPLPDLAQMIAGALEPTPAPMGPNARFGYPLHGGFQALMDGFLPLCNGELALQTAVVDISPSRRRARLDDGRIVEFDRLISTMPLPRLVAACGDEAPAEVRAAAQALRHVSVRCVNLGIGLPPGVERLTDKHWIYYPEDTVFHRIFVQGNASPHCNPEGGFGLICEISYSAAKPLPCDGQALIDRVIADCRKVGIIGDAHPVLVANQVDMPCAYVVYDHGRAANVALIRDWFARSDIVLAGRYAEWEYYNSDHAFLAGKRAAEEALAARPPLDAPAEPLARAS